MTEESVVHILTSLKAHRGLCGAFRRTMFVIFSEVEMSRQYNPTFCPECEKIYLSMRRVAYFPPPRLQRLAVVPTRYPWVVLKNPGRDHYYVDGSLHVLCGAAFPRPVEVVS